MQGTSLLWKELVRAELLARGADLLLVERSATVVERLAAGGGATNWYRLERPSDLDELVQFLRPGSDLRVCFAADQFAEGPFGPELARRVEEIARQDIDAVILARREGIRLKHDFPSSADEAAEFVAEESLDGRVWVGRFPDRTDDGVNGIRLDLPDQDGVVRPHPH